MLENEPDTVDQPAPPPPRRRRAAVRPAGPPAPVAETPVAAPVEAASQAEVPAPTTDQPVAVAPSADTPPLEAPAPDAPVVGVATTEEPAVAVDAVDQPEVPVTAAPKRTRRTTKKAAAEAAPPAPDEPALPADSVAPATRTPRRRTAKKAAAPAAAPAPAEAPRTEAAGSTKDPAPEPASDTAGADAVVTAAAAPPAVVEVGADAGKDRPPSQTRPLIADPFALPTAPQQAAGSSQAAGHVDLSTELVGDAEPQQATEQTQDTEPVQDTQLADDTGQVEVAEESDDADQDDDTSEDVAEGPSRRRRRRRGGRRRRRGGDEDDSEADLDADPDTADTGDASDPTATTTPPGIGEAEAGSAADEDESSPRRRRRRRRRGEDAAAAPDDPAEVVVKVRESRSRRKASSEVTGIDGSTRMEAKRQRRREGREAGRRRPPILSEAEFLARRESVNRRMIIRQRDDLTQIAVLEDDVLVEHYVDRDSAASLIGNVYLGRVQNVLPSMEAAFIDIGRGRNAVLYAGEVDWDSFGAEGQARKVEKVLKSGQTVLVQVSKDPVAAKGARLTNHVTIPGRYIVYAPGGHLSGISRKLPDTERKRLKDILSQLLGDSASVIVRTAAEGASEEELVRDVNRLQAQWQDIERKVKAGNAPQLLYGEPDLTVRIVRDLFTEDFTELIIQGNGGMNDAYESIEAYVTHVAPHLQDRLRRWEPEDGEEDLFTAHRLDEQIAKGLERKVFLPSGGSLIIDRTEAMTVIDVNTGKFTGTGGNLEATVTSNNLEAAEEIVRQLRLRDIGGIIVIDFIDMVLPNNRELLLRRLVECLSRDRTRHQVAEVTSLGLVQMTRKRIGTGLLEAFSTECPHCHGRGVHLHDMPVDSQKQADGGTRDRGRERPRANGSGSRRSPAAKETEPSDLEEAAAGRS